MRILFEEHAPLLLILHAIAAFAAVALSTHLVFWLRHYFRGPLNKRRAVQRFARWSAGGYVITVLLGLALYPAYRVRVRAEHLENPSAISRDIQSRAMASVAAQQRNQESRNYRQGHPPTTSPAPSATDEMTTQIEASVQREAQISRWFDVKEHWSAIGLVVSLSLVFILVAWDPEQPEKLGIRFTVIGLAVIVAASSWAAAIIGLVTTATRSVAS